MFLLKMFYQFCIGIESVEPPRLGPYSSQAPVVILNVQSNQNVKSKGKSVQSKPDKRSVQNGTHPTSGGLNMFNK
jgi:hypothetical protein